jgi:hypothetical protein
MVVWIASWDSLRIPVALAPIDPKRKGHQNILCRQMLTDFEPPAWGREIIVVADAGYAAHVTRKLIHELHWTSVFAMPRTRKFTNGKVNMYATWCSISPKAAIVVGLRPSPERWREVGKQPLFGICFGGPCR